MARLSISLLGPLEVKVDGDLVVGFASDKVRALLAYLATESNRPHRREALAGLLWPDYPDRSARTNLRNALSNLRAAIGDRIARPPYLLVSRQTLQINAASNQWVDVAAFEALAGAAAVSEGAPQRWEEALSLYRGAFLEGFSLVDSPPFEDWALVTRERLQRQALSALQQIGGYYEERGEYEQARAHTWRWVELAPWQEEAHRALMRLLALNGQRGVALTQYEACCRALRAELDVEPSEDTVRLYHSIRDGELGPVTRQAKMQPASSVWVAPPSERSPEPLPSAQEGPTGPSVTHLPSTRAASLTQGERRIITILVAQVKERADRVEQLGVEAWVAIMNHVFRLLESEIDLYGGEVEQYREDGLIAFFGLPAAHEDDPERAVLAALAMQESVAPYAVELAKGEGISLTLQIGIHTGEVVSTAVGRRQGGQDMARGQAIALAVRMLAAAKPGAVLVTENTYRRVASLFEWEVLQAVEVGGMDRPAAVYQPLTRAMAGMTEQTRGRGIAGLKSTLVGRRVEFRALQEAVERLRNGLGAIVTVVGEAGIGKSRLLAEMRRWALGQADDAELGRGLPPPSPQWIEGHCLSYSGGLAYQLWLEVLRALLGVAPDMPSSAVRGLLREQVQALCSARFADIYPYLGRMMSLPLSEEVEARLGAMGAESLKVNTFRALESLLEGAARRRPLVVVCEDLHWADPTSLELLEHTLALTDRVPLMLICLFRPGTQRDYWHIKEVAAREYHHRHVDLWLDPLTADEAETLVGNLLQAQELLPESSADLAPSRAQPGSGQDGPTIETAWVRPAPGLLRELRERILAYAEGNPFYVEEIIRSLIHSGAIVRDESTGRWVATQSASEVAIPDSLHGVLMARIDLLPEGARQVLQTASVIGRTFSYRVLVQVLGGEELHADLVVLLRSEMIREQARVPEAEYAFRHHLTQEVAYRSLLSSRRRELHRKIGSVIESLFPERLSEHRPVIGEHYLQGEVWDLAFDHLTQAGDDAIQQFAFAEARQHYTGALDALTRLPRTEENRRRLVDTLIKRTASSWRSDSPDLNLARLAEASRLVEELSDIDGARDDDALRLAQIRFWMGRLYYMRNAVGEAIACYEQVLPVAEAWGDDRLLAVASSAIGQAMLIQGYANRAEPLLSQAVSLFEEIGDWSEWIRAMGFHGVALVAKGGYAAGLAEILRARARAQEIGALSEIAMNDLILASAYTMGGDVSRALEVAHEAVEKAEQSGDRLYVYIGYLRYAWATCRAGQIDAAVANLAKAQAMADVLAGPLIYVHHLAALRAEIAFAAGEVEAALGLARRAVELAEAMDGIEGEGLARRVWGQALAGLVSSALPAPPSHLHTPRSRVREAAEASPWDEAEKQLATSLGLLLSGHLRLEAARTHLAWGTICRDRGDPDAARAHWAKAAAQFKESELPWESARLQTLIRSLDLGLSGES